MPKRKNYFLFIVMFIAVVAVCCFVYFSSYFERVKPNIITPSISYWNLQWNVPIKISDSSGIKSYKVTLTINGEEKVLLNNSGKNKQEVEFSLPIPTTINIADDDKLLYKIEAIDNSKWRFFLGNVNVKELDLIVDRSKPKVRIVAMSNKITRGGSAAVVFFAEDNAIGDIAVSNGYQSFVAFPFVKEHYYISIVPWSIQNPNFQGSIIIKDKAGNIRKSNIGFAQYARNYRVSNLVLKDSFIDGKISELIDNIDERPLDSFTSRLEMFKYINETIRERDLESIKSKILNLSLWNAGDSIKEINVFKPLKDAYIVGLYGDHRKYSINKQDAGESYHLGTDLAKIKNMPIVASNDGIVVMSSELGIHGNAIMIDHGYGITSLYAHLSEQYVKEGDTVKRGDIIGKTGATGLAFGDHLHFGILIQGIPVLSTEWMDSKWLKSNINDVLLDAKNTIRER